MVDAQPPGPKGHFLLGSLPDFREDPLGFAERAFAEHGDVVRARFLHMPLYMVRHPDDVREVLLDPQGALCKGMPYEGFRPMVGKGLLLNEGESHKRQRRMMQPAFHRQRVMGYGEAMVADAARARDALSPGPVDLAAALSSLTLSIAARTLFGVGLADTDGADVAECMGAFAGLYHQNSHPLGPILGALPTATTRRYRAAKARLDALVDRMIRARREGGDTGDILSMLVFARDEEGDGAAMADDHLHDEAITLLVAGHETTAAGLAWAFVLLARHPEVRARMEAELDALGGPPTVADLPRLTYTQGVFGEALRLWPPSLALPRQAQKAMQIRDYTVPAGAIVMVSTWCTHRDPRFWEAPLEVRPERWSPEARAGRHKYAFYAFGGGARVCVGEAFAWMEGTLLLATLGQRWRAELTGPVVPDTAFTLRPKGGLPVVLTAR